MIYRLVAYSFILLGILGTIYMGVEGIFGDRYNTPTLSVQSLSRQLFESSDIILIDVRTESEISESPAPWPTSFQIPLVSLDDRCTELTDYRSQKMVLLCPTGNRSRQGARILRQAGFDAWYLENGMSEGRNLE